MFSSICCLGSHFWKCKPSGRHQRRDPDFLKTNISAKNQGSKKVSLIVLMFFCDLSGIDNLMALT